VKDVLFPYVTKHLKKYLTEHWEEPTTVKDVADLEELSKQDQQNQVKGIVPIVESNNMNEKLDSVIANVNWLMDKDRKTTALKQLQGHIWKQGFDSKEIIGDVYDDVPECFKQWHEQGIKLFIYSSGSIDAQKLLFSNTRYGDLLPLISGHFDTSTGAKLQSDSYRKISQLINTTPQDILFLTDSYEEAQAANQALFDVVLLNRPGNAPLPPDNRHRTAANFNELNPLIFSQPHFSCTCNSSSSYLS